MYFLRALLCGFLALLVAISFAPESFAHGIAPDCASLGISATSACHGAQVAPADDAGDPHAPGAPCEDCCHSGHCHMKAAPVSNAAGHAFSLTQARLAFGEPARFVDAPQSREPDPERT